MFACTKWDALKDTADPEALRVLAHSLRWLAHSNSAHLVYVGGLQPGATGEEPEYACWDAAAGSSTSGPSGW